MTDFPPEGATPTTWPGVWVTEDRTQYVIDLQYNQGWLTVPVSLNFGEGGFERWIRKLRASAEVSHAFDIPPDLAGVFGSLGKVTYTRSDREYDAGVGSPEPGTGPSLTSEGVEASEAVAGGQIVSGGGWMATVVIDRFNGRLPFEVEYVTVPVTAFVDGFPHVPWVGLPGKYELVSTETIRDRQLVLLWHPDQGTSNPHRNRPASVTSRRAAERHCKRWYKTNFPQKKG